MEIPKHLEKHFIHGKIISGLKHSDVKEDFHFEPHGTSAHVAHLPNEGVICLFKLGSGGLQYQRGEIVSIIPLQELISLFERVDPKFAEPPDKGIKPAKTPAPAGMPPRASGESMNIPSKVAAQPSIANVKNPQTGPAQRVARGGLTA